MLANFYELHGLYKKAMKEYKKGLSRNPEDEFLKNKIKKLKQEVKKMKKLLNLAAITALTVMISLTLNTTKLAAQADAPEVKTYIDVDGDGIPNGQDPDFVRGASLGRGSKVNFIDEDGDGICDLYQTGNQAGRQFGRHSGQMNFIDADGDGVCDNTANQGRGFGNGQARIINFIDEDGDGVCDNYPNGLKAAKQLGKRQYKRGRSK